MESVQPEEGAAADALVCAVGGPLIDAVPVAIYVCDAAGVIVRYNPKAVELWGRAPQVGDPEQLFCGSLRLHRVNGGLLPHDEMPMAWTLRTGEAAENREVVIERPDGSRIWALVNIAPLEDGEGRLIGAVNCFQDITARKRAERAAQETRDFLIGVIETTPECVKVVARDGRLLRINSAGLHMVEADSLDQIQGSDILQLIAPAYRTRWGEHHRRVCDGETLSWEFELVSLKGTQRHMESHAVPLALPDGSVAQLAVTRDVSQRKRDEQALREGEQRLREILGALPTAVYTTDAEGRLTFYNEAAADFWGCRPILGEAAWRGAWRIFQPDGSPLPHEACPMVVALKERRALRHAEAICERPDGRRIPFAAYPTPMWRADGKLAGAVNMLVDISRHKQAEEHQQLLVNELNHRVKNTLATVQSIVRHSLRGAESVESFRATFGGRLMALSRAHDLLTQRHWEGAALTVLLEQAVAPYEGATQALAPRSPGARVRLDGPDVALSARQALVLAMAFHELATNAAKYGALSTEEGRLEIVWTIEEAAADAPAQLLLRWCEQGGPRVEPPSRRGFGSRLIERSVPGELMGDVRLDYQPEGLRCAMRIPVGVADVLH